MNTHGSSNQPVLELHKQIHMYLLALESWAKVLFINSLGVHNLNHTHSLANIQWSGLSDQRTLLPHT